MLIDFGFVEPDVTTLDSLKQCILYFLGSLLPPMVVNVDTTFNPRKASAISSDKLKNIRVVKIKMAYNSSIAVGSSSAKNFVECGVDACKGHWA
jgi:hypothetical protein